MVEAKGSVRLHELKNTPTQPTCVAESEREEVVMLRLYLYSHSFMRDNISTTAKSMWVQVKSACDAILEANCVQIYLCVSGERWFLSSQEVHIYLCAEPGYSDKGRNAEDDE